MDISLHAHIAFFQAAHDCYLNISVNSVILYSYSEGKLDIKLNKINKLKKLSKGKNLKFWIMCSILKQSDMCICTRSKSIESVAKDKCVDMLQFKYTKLWYKFAADEELRTKVLKQI